MKTKDIINIIADVVVLPPAMIEKVEERLEMVDGGEMPVVPEYMDNLYEKVAHNKWKVYGHYLRIARHGKMVTPTVDCSVTFWVVTMRDLAEALTWINGK